jgi:hypothetical protein
MRAEVLLRLALPGFYASAGKNRLWPRPGPLSRLGLCGGRLGPYGPGLMAAVAARSGSRPARAGVRPGHESSGSRPGVGTPCASTPGRRGKGGAPAAGARGLGKSGPDRGGRRSRSWSGRLFWRLQEFPIFPETMPSKHFFLQHCLSSGIFFIFSLFYRGQMTEGAISCS